MHFVLQDKLFVNCAELLRELKRKDRLPGYSKHSNYTLGLYEKLKKDIDTAIKNSIGILEKHRQPGEQHSYTNMHEMIASLDKIHLK